MERANFANCLNNALPQMLSIKAADGTTVQPGLWTSLSDWIGEGSFDGAQDKRWEKFFTNPRSRIACELESEFNLRGKLRAAA